ncbi:MAG: hypothetical protein HQL63_08665 [Magnetococcales bacterium]|nr:hypothetical protein [Magnetococcales bacterium]MBF0322441.1 hypothetical protein [Magnetococcales bacterium]
MVLLRTVMIVLAVLVTGTALAGEQAADDLVLANGGVRLQKPKGKACIRPTEWMRRNHMDLLIHKQAMTVREGARMRSESLLQCQSCHPNREAFCDRCHDYAGVEPNCFECHNYPE